MVTEPKLEQRNARHYVAIRTQASMKELETVLPVLFPELFAWLQKQGESLAGPPFIRYIVVDMERQLDFEVGLPVAAALAGDARVSAGIIPAGCYATCIHTGHYANLREATATLHAWAEKNGIVWNTSEAENGQKVWGGRFEFYLTDPANEPNPEKWETELAFLTQA